MLPDTGITITPSEAFAFGFFAFWGAEAGRWLCRVIKSALDV